MKSMPLVIFLFSLLFCTAAAAQCTGSASWCQEQMRRICDPRAGGDREATCRAYFGGRPPNYPGNPAIVTVAPLIGALLSAPPQAPQQPETNSFERTVQDQYARGWQNGTIQKSLMRSYATSMKSLNSSLRQMTSMKKQYLKDKSLSQSERETLIASLDENIERTNNSIAQIKCMIDSLKNGGGENHMMECYE